MPEIEDSVIDATAQADDDTTVSDALSDAYDRAMSSSDDVDEATGDPSGDVSDDDGPKNEVAATKDDGDESQADDTGETIPKPDAWSSDRAELWLKLPKEAQEYIAQREAQAHSRISQLGHSAKQAEPYIQLAREFQAYIPEGMSAPQAAEELWKAHAVLTQDPVAGIEWLAGKFGVDLTQYGQSGATDELSNLRREVASMRTQQQRNQAASMASREASTVSLIDRWAEDKPYYDSVVGDMIHILPTVDTTGKTESEVLDEAYRKACRLNDDVWSAMQREREAERVRDERTRRHSADASKNKRLNGGSTGPRVNRASNIDVDDDAAMQALYERLASSER